MRFLFWNTKGNPVLPNLARLARTYDPDFIILAESAISPVAAVELLNEREQDRVYLQPVNFSDRLQIFPRLTSDLVRPVFDTLGLSIVHISPPAAPDFLLAAVHLPSKLHLQDAEQASLCPRFVADIEEAERAHGHLRTIVVGDFNMNPFESGMVGAEGFHAVMTQAVAKRRSRRVLGKQRRFFFNPMWKWFGDEDGPSGTYYRGNGVIAYFWNMFDQLLVRPELLPWFQSDALQIVTSDGEVDLRRPDGRPDRDVSDHFPIVFAFDF